MQAKQYMYVTVLKHYMCVCVFTLTHIKRMCVSTYMRVYIDNAICQRVQHAHLLGFANLGLARFP